MLAENKNEKSGCDGPMENEFNTYDKSKNKGKKFNNKGVLFCFTDFQESNINSTKYDEVFEENKDYVRGMAWGKEICPKTKRNHNQAFIQLYEQDRWNRIIEIFHIKGHIMRCKGTVKQNETYCQKEGQYKQLGNFISRGYRSDLDNIKQDLKSGCTLADIAENYTGNYIRYHSGIKSLKGHIDKVNRADFRELQVYYLYGEAGSGKTSYVNNKHGVNNVFTIDRKMMSSEFWGNYDGEKILLIDDFNGWITKDYLLRILDGHQMWLNIKNGNTYAAWTTVYITSNKKPGDMYQVINDNLKRRFGHSRQQLPEDGIFHNCLEVRKGNTSYLSHPWQPTKPRCNIGNLDTDSDSESY